MITENDKATLIKKIDEANEILSEYAVKLEYAQYTCDESEPLKPGLFCSASQLCERNKKIVKISLEVIKEEKKVAFYISSVNYNANNLSDSVSCMDVFKKALNDITKLNQIGLWVSDDLTSLYS